MPGLPKGPGYYAITRHADILEMSKRPDAFSSAQGATSIPDLPTEMNEFYGSMINMDDPRHQRLRGIVSRRFTPRMVQQVMDDVARVATRVVDDVIDKGTMRLRSRDRVSPAADHHLQPDGRSRERSPAGARPVEHHPLGGRPGIHSGRHRSHRRVHDRRRVAGESDARPGAGADEAADRRPHLGAGQHRARRRAAHRRRGRVVLHPARRRRQRDHAHGDQPWPRRAARAPGAEAHLDAGRRGRVARRPSRRSSAGPRR